MHEIDLQPHDEITLYSDEEQVVIDQVNQEFRQENKLKGELREFTLFNDIYCRQMVNRKHGGQQLFHINLICLDAKPQRDFVLADNWLILAAISTVISFMLVYLVWFSHFEIDKYLGTILSVASISFSIICFLLAMLKTRSRLQFVSKFSHVPVLELMKNKPDKKSFEDFMQSLSQHIISAQSRAKLSTTERLKLEMKELRRLKDENIIAEPIYEQAKTLILRNKAFTAGDST
jgi:hypothetical protein